MLPRQNRLTKERDIVALVKGGLHLKLATIRIHYQATGSKTTRIAVVVGKKVNPSAVRRHRIKRQLRAAASRFIKQVPQGFDMVWIATPETDKVRGPLIDELNITKNVTN